MMQRGELKHDFRGIFVHVHYYARHVCALLLATSVQFRLTTGAAAGTEFVKTTGRQLTTTYGAEVLVPSVIACCYLCGHDSTCWSAGFKGSGEGDGGHCVLSGTPLVAALLHSSPNADWNIYSKNDWHPVYRGIAGIGRPFYEGYLSGDEVASFAPPTPTCCNPACDRHCRSGLVDIWASLPIAQVKFAFFKNSAEAAHITFDGMGSDVKSWFSPDRVVNSTWDGVDEHISSYGAFSADGDVEGSMRRFMIARPFSSCSNDQIAMVVITARVYSCNFDNQPAFPQFIYSTGSQWAYPDLDQGDDLADYIEIYIK